MSVKDLEIKLWNDIQAIVNKRVPYKDYVLKEYSKEDHYSTVFLKAIKRWPNFDYTLSDLRRLEYSLWITGKMEYLIKPPISLEKEFENNLDTPLTVSPAIAYLIEAGEKRFNSLTF